jgi:hypothetical protein
MRLLLPLLLASLLTLGLAVSSVGRGQAPQTRGSFCPYGGQKEPRDGRCSPSLGSLPAPGVPREPRNAAPPRVRCAHPGSLSLRRFEDGSAQLRCADRVLVRVAVPG